MPEFVTAENLEFLGMFGLIIIGFALQPVIGNWSAFLIFGSMAIIPLTEFYSELHYANMNLLEAVIANYEKGRIQFWIRKDFTPMQLKPLARVSPTLKTKFGLRETDLHRVSLGIEPVDYKDFGKIENINITYWGRWEDRVKFRPRSVTVMGTRFKHGNVEYPILWELETQDVHEGVRIPEFFLFATANGDKGKTITQYEVNVDGLDEDARQLVITLQNQLAYYQAELSQMKQENIGVRSTQGNWASVTKGLMRKMKLGMDGVRMVFAGALADHDTIRSAFRSTAGSSKFPYLLAGGIILALVVIGGLLANPAQAAALGRWVSDNELFLIVVAIIIGAVAIYGGFRRR